MSGRLKMANRRRTERGREAVGSSRLRAYAPALVGAMLLVVYVCLGANALNLDGLGYAGRVESGVPRQLLLPGHLLYAPIMYAIYRLVSVFASVDAARLMQVCDAVFAAAGVGVFIAALRKLSVGTFTAVAASLALASSYTYWTHATDLTTYAFSTFCLLCAFYFLCAARARGRSAGLWAIGRMVALATLIHQSNLVFIPAAMLGVGAAGTRLRQAMRLAAISLALICLPYGILGWVATGSGSPSVIAKWAASGAHGYAATFEPVNLARGVYGSANAVLYLDDAGTAIKGRAANIAGSKFSSNDMLRLAGKTAFLAALLGVPSVGYMRRRRLTDDQKWAARVCLAWIVPYVLVALVFFTTDHDRWIMLLPAVAALVAVAYPRPSLRGKIAAVSAVAMLCALNLTSAVYPAHTGASNRYYQEALRLAPQLAPTDLVIFWGHDHIGTSGYLRQLGHMDAMHVVDQVLKHGKQEALRDLTDAVRAATSRNHRVLVIGFYGDANRASDYLSEAHALGVSREDVSRALGQFRAKPAFTIGSETVYVLTPETDLASFLLFPVPCSLYPPPQGSAT